MVLFLLPKNKKTQIGLHKAKTKRSKYFIDKSLLKYKLTEKYFPSLNPDYDNNILTVPKVKYKNIKQQFRKYNKFKVSQKTQTSNKRCVPFKVKNGTSTTPICIFDPGVDRMISSYINDYGTWEPDLIEIVTDILTLNRDLLFVDLGCNLGTFTISVASLGTKVIAVDVLPTALENLQESLKRGNLEEQVIILNNAISNQSGTVNIKVIEDNPGGSFIKNEKTNEETIAIESIQLNNLVDLVDGKDVFLKMDIEGSEWSALASGVDFFNELNVRFILMEWMLHKGNTSGRQIIEFLISRGFIPYLDYKTGKLLKAERSAFWMDNILWAKR